MPAAGMSAAARWIRPAGVLIDLGTLLANGDGRSAVSLNGCHELDAPSAPQRSGRRDMPSPRCRLRTSPPAPSKAMVTINQVLASARSGLDQSTVYRTRPQASYVVDGCLNSSRASSLLAVTAPATPRLRSPRNYTNPWDAGGASGQQGSP